MYLGLLRTVCIGDKNTGISDHQYALLIGKKGAVFGAFYIHCSEKCFG
jgi:hypothetical protein